MSVKYFIGELKYNSNDCIMFSCEQIATSARKPFLATREFLLIPISSGTSVAFGNDVYTSDDENVVGNEFIVNKWLVIFFIIVLYHFNFILYTII